MIILLIIISIIGFIISRVIYEDDIVGFPSMFRCIICNCYILRHCCKQWTNHRRKDFNVPGRKYENRKANRYIGFQLYEL